MSFIGRSWHGAERLWKVYWLYGVLGGALVQLVVTVLGKMATPLAIGGAIFYFVFVIWNLVSIWRCAWNCGWQGWGYIVRILVIAAPVLIIVGLLVGGVLVGQDLVKAAECRKAQMETAKSLGMDFETYRRSHPGECASRGASSMRPAPAPISYANPCEQQMGEYALANHGDPKVYIAENQAWLNQCLQQMNSGAQ